MNTEIRLLAHDNLEDFTQLLNVFDMVFEYEDGKRPDSSYLQSLLENEKFKVVVARAGQKVIGGLTAYVLDQYHSQNQILYMYDLAVLTEYQRMGIGRKLIEFTQEYCRKHGFQQSFIQAEKVDEYAVDFYRKTRPSGELVTIHFYYNFVSDHNK